MTCLCVWKLGVYAIGVEMIAWLPCTACSKEISELTGWSACELYTSQDPALTVLDLSKAQERKFAEAECHTHMLLPWQHAPIFTIPGSMQEPTHQFCV